MTVAPLQDLDPCTVPLSGRNAIDASAGTGKTHAITRLYLRLVLESDEPGDERVERILVVTYTKAATAELRHRIRTVLTEALATLDRRERGRPEDPRHPDDPVLSAVRSAADLASAKKRLQEALSGFDRASIFTIHSFCQRALAESAFESARPFECEIEASDADVLRETVDDYWRNEVATVSRLFADFLLRESKTGSPDSLAKQIRSYVGMRGLALLPAEVTEKPDEAAFQATFERTARAWVEAQPALCDFVVAGVIDGAPLGLPGRAKLNGQRINEKARRSLFDTAARAFARDSIGLDLFPKIERLDREHLQAITREGIVPDLPLFDLCGELIRQVEPFRRWEIELRKRLLAWAPGEIQRRRARRGVQSYDDLLLHLLDAIERPGGERLAARLRARWPIALIDEFQDTDPAQFRIFDRVYPRQAAGGRTDGGESPYGPLFFVGDPKQAIYSFRRADVFAYLEARSQADAIYELRRNHRSDPLLVKGVRTLFDVPQPLVFDEITPSPAEAAERTDREELVTPGDERPPLRISFLQRRTNDKDVELNLAAKAAVRLATRETVGEIAALLESDSGATIRGWDGATRKVLGSDIAVLVRSNQQAKQVRRALTATGIPSVLSVQASVFGTETASELERVLRAVQDPSDERLLCAAFATSLCGVSGEDVDAARRAPDSDAARDWEERVQNFRNYNRTWANRGFLEMFRALLDREGIPARILRAAEGERRLTDLLHLGECLGSEAVHRRLRIEALMTWFADARRRAGDDESVDDADDSRMRLESDDELVKIVTVHKSKGLQYGIVFLPFAWDGRLHAGGKSPQSVQKRDPVFFHVPDGGGFTTALDFGSAEYPRNAGRMSREERAEILRLFYVAITRAKHRCHIIWGRVGTNRGGNNNIVSATSAPAWLFHRRPLAGEGPRPTDPEAAELADFEEIRRQFEGLHDADLRQDLEALRERAPDCIDIDLVEEAPVSPLSRSSATRRALRARSWTAEHEPRASRMLSFTYLATSHASDAAGPASEASDVPDHDGGPETPVARPGGFEDVAAFPSGPVAGEAFHAVFERLAFEDLDPDDAGAVAEKVRPFVASALVTHGLRDAAAWTPEVARTIARTVCTPLDAALPPNAKPGASLRIAGLRPENRLQELEFHFPIAEVNGARLAEAIRTDAACRGFSWSANESLEGFLKGYVDLVFQGDDGRFYVVDYKSNRLGDSVSDYAHEALRADMAKHRYPLQSLIYTFALHRLLRSRLPGYDPAEHLGGSFYLYLRAVGLGPDPAAGIFHLAHSADTLDALDAAVGRTDGRDRSKEPR